MGRDSSITVAPEKGAADVDDSDSSTDEEEMNDVMAKLLTKQGKTALGLKEEGNASFKLGTKEVCSHRDSSVPLSPVPVLPFSRSPVPAQPTWCVGGQGYHRAASRYSQGLCLDADDALRVVLHSNHAECMIQLGRNMKAKISADAALAIQPDHEKSLKRLQKVRTWIGVLSGCLLMVCVLGVGEGGHSAGQAGMKRPNNKPIAPSLQRQM